MRDFWRPRSGSRMTNGSHEVSLALGVGRVFSTQAISGGLAPFGSPAKGAAQKDDDADGHAGAARIRARLAATVIHELKRPCRLG